MATLTAALGTVRVPGPVSKPALVPILAPGPGVPIVVQMGAVGDRTTSVAPLPTFGG